VPLIALDTRHRDDLGIEMPGFPGVFGFGLGQRAELVDRDPAHAPARGDPLGGQVLVGQVDVPRGRPWFAHLGAHVGAQGNAAHRLDAAPDTGVDRARADEPGDQVDRLLRRAALAVDGHAPGARRQARVQPPRAGDVVRLLTRLGDTTACDLLHEGRVDARAVDHRPLGRSEQLSRMETGQPSAALADRGPYRLNYHRTGHMQLLPRKSVIKK
jgi:hypothetical protein